MNTYFLSPSAIIILFYFSLYRVDFFIPGVETVGGFSICSSPKTLKDTSTIELAVKYSDHPPALWVHTKVCVLLYKAFAFFMLKYW